MAPPMFHFAIVGARRGFSSSVLLVLDGAFVYLFNVVLVARLDLFPLRSCWCSTGLLLIFFVCFMKEQAQKEVVVEKRKRSAARS